MSDVTIEIKHEDEESRKHRLRKARRESIKVWTLNIEAARSAFELQKSGHLDSFCGVTVSKFNIFLRYYQTFSCLVTAISLFLAPYQYFYRSTIAISYFNSASDMVYLLVVLFRSKTRFMIEGIEELSLLKVRKRYQSSFSFAIDTLTFLPLLLRLLTIATSYPVIYTLIRQTIFLRIHYVLYYLASREKESGSSTLLYRTTRYAFLSALAIHLTACGWYGLACSRAENSNFSLDLCVENSWIRFLPQNILRKVIAAAVENDKVVSSEVSFLHNTYVTSLYWASATVTSTGYGDIHAYTVSEKIYSMFAMIIGMSVLYGMTMGGMTSMLINIDAQRSTFVHRYQSFEKEVNRMGVSTEVKELCLNYFDYLWRRWEGEDVHFKDILNVLPYCVKASFAEKRFYNFLHKADLLADTEEAFLRNLSLFCKPVVFLENQFIQKSGEICSTMFYLHTGIVEILDETESEVIALMHPGKIFGQVMLVYDLPRINSIRCRTNCDVFVLEKHDFRTTLCDYPESAAMFLTAARRKCSSSDGMWPIVPPSDVQLRHFVEKTNISRQRASSFVFFGSPEQSSAALSMRRRLTTVHSTNYTGISLSRVPMRKKSADRESTSRSERRASLVDFMARGIDRNVVSIAHLNDGTKIFVNSRSKEVEVKDAVGNNAGYSMPDKPSFANIFKHTTINPNGRLYQIWLDYLFVITIVAGMYTTLIASFTTTPGRDDDLYGEDILVMATDSCNTTQNNLYKECPSWPFNDTILCLRNLGGSFSNRVLGNQTEGFRVQLPSRFDLSSSAYNFAMPTGRLHYFFSFLVIDLSFYLNILINFRTEVFTPNGFLTTFKDIARNYNKWNKLWLDILGVFPFEILALFVGCSTIEHYHLIAFFRLNRMLYFFRYVRSSFARWEYSLDVNIIRIRTIKFIVYIYSITHLCSCLFYFLSCSYFVQSYAENVTYKCAFGSWGWVFDISYLTSYISDYAKTMYWASTTMTSTGYGDISASNTNGRVFSLVTMIVGTVMYGWLVAVIASTVSNSEAAGIKFSNSMTDLKNYLVVHEVSHSLIHRVMDVRRIEWERYAGTAIPGKQTIGEELSEILHTTLFYDSWSTSFSRLPFFHNVDSSFIAVLCNHIKVFHYSAGDMIIYEGDLSRDLYLIKKGLCAVVSEDLEKKVKLLREGEYFGECEMLFGCGSPSTVIAETACELLILGRRDLDKTLDSFPTLQSQMTKIENNEEYKNSILQAIKRSNESIVKPSNLMNKYYHMEVLDFGLKICTVSAQENPPIIRSEVCFAGLGVVEQMLSSLLSHFAFDPHSHAYFIYETIRICFIIISMILIPLQFAYLPSNVLLLVLVYFLDLLSLFDQYVKIHTCYYTREGVLVSYPARCALRYFSSSCIVDFLSWFPFEVFAVLRMRGTISEQQFRFLGVIRVTRLLQMYKVHAYFSYWLSGMREHKRSIKALRNTIYGLLLHHWFACILFVAACEPEFYNKDGIYSFAPDKVLVNASGGNSYCSNTSWISAISRKNVFPSMQVLHSVSDQYIVSLYWATSTSVCVGYGDIHAHTPVDMLLAALIMVFGTVYYSYVLGGMSAAVQTDDVKRANYKRRLTDIVKFFKVYNVSKETENQVLDYYCYLWDRTGGVSPNKLFSGLPCSIRTSVCQCMYGPMIREAFEQGGMTDKETRGFFRLLSRHVTPALFMKKGIICRCGLARYLLICLKVDTKFELVFFLSAYKIFNNPIIALDTRRPLSYSFAVFTIIIRSEFVKAPTKHPSRRGDIGTEMFFIQRGTVSILDDDDETTMKFLGPGQHFGEVALIFETPRCYTIIATTNCEVNTLNKKDMDGILNVFPQFRERMTAIAQRCAIDKDATFSLVWNHVGILLSFLSALISVYQACFFSHNIILYAIGYVLDVWFVADMMVSFHTSFYDQFCTNIDALDLINLRYAKSLDLFALDLVANLPLEFVFVFTTNLNVRLTIICYARLNRLLRFYRLHRTFKYWTQDIRTNVLMVRLYESLLYIFFTIHFVGCVWQALACPSGQCQTNSWVFGDNIGYQNASAVANHIVSWVDCVYWTVATMTSTGYGDIRPLTGTEMLYACFVMVLGKLMIGYVLGLVAATIANDERLRVVYKQDVSAVKSCMVEHKFGNKLFNHVVHYYEYMWMKNRAVDVVKLFHDIPFSLRADIFSQICGDMVHSMKLFEGCPENFIRHLCMVMVPTAYMPGDYICLEGDVRTEAFILYRGVAEAVKRVNNSNVKIRLVMEGESFLCESLLCQVRRPCSLRARTYVDAFSMTMDGMQSVVVHHSGVYNKILENARRLYPELLI